MVVALVYFKTTLPNEKLKQNLAIVHTYDKQWFFILFYFIFSTFASVFYSIVIDKQNISC